MTVPEQLVSDWNGTPAGAEWVGRLPAMVADLERRWSLTLGPPYEGDDVTAAWVAPVHRADGTAAVLKVAMPHLEAEHEIDGLRFWDGDPTVRLLEADERLNAMLIERCEPGTTLRSEPDDEQDVVVADLLRRLWRTPPDPSPFRPLSVMVDYWIDETNANEHRWRDAGLVREGTSVFAELAHDATAPRVLLATDLHAGNILAAQREPWLAIDPKPFVGDPAYDPTQHLFNGLARLHRDPSGTIARVAELVELDAERVRRWTFARAAAETHDGWDADWTRLARALAD